MSQPLLPQMRVPAEIFDLFLDEATTGSLAKCCALSQSSGGRALLKLYSCIVIKHSRLLKLVQQITPDTARLVREFTVIDPDGDFRSGSHREGCVHLTCLCVLTELSQGTISGQGLSCSCQVPKHHPHHHPSRLEPSSGNINHVLQKSSRSVVLPHVPPPPHVPGQGESMGPISRHALQSTDNRDVYVPE